MHHAVSHCCHLLVYVAHVGMPQKVQNGGHGSSVILYRLLVDLLVL